MIKLFHQFYSLVTDTARVLTIKNVLDKIVAVSDEVVLNDLV